MKRVVISFFLSVMAIWAMADNDKQMFSFSQNVEVFSSVLKHLNSYYVDTVDIDKCVEVGVSAMLSQLDPYTMYFTEEEAKTFEEQNAGEYAGVGCTIMQRDSAVYISEPFEDTPAHELGLRAGDKIVMIDNDTVLGWKSDEVSKRMRGLPNTTFRMVLQRPGVDSLIDVKVTRRFIQRNPVVYYGVLADSVGYILLESFTEKAADEVRKAFIDLKENKGVVSLILDLRDNGGGLLGQAVDIVSMFVPRGTRVVDVRSRDRSQDYAYTTNREPIDTKMPLAVLINGYSASASEVLAGALQDLDRAVILGTRSFGKGLVQQVFPLPYSRQMKVTVSHYYIPSGRSLQAIDYSKRNEDGSVARVPDSLTNVYETAAGRIVRDGGGITPDLKIEPDTMSNLHYYLLLGNHIFDYATQYVVEHDSIGVIDDFVLTDTDYDNFKAFIAARDFKYDKMSSKQLDNLREMMTFEGYMDDTTRQLVDSLEQLLEHNLNKDLDTFSKEILGSLMQEIAKRYYYQKGEIVVGLRNDVVSMRAIEILLSPTRYREILAPSKK